MALVTSGQISLTGIWLIPTARKLTSPVVRRDAGVCWACHLSLRGQVSIVAALCRRAMVSPSPLTVKPDNPRVGRILNIDPGKCADVMTPQPFLLLIFWSYMLSLWAEFMLLILFFWNLKNILSVHFCSVIKKTQPFTFKSFLQLLLCVCGGQRATWGVQLPLPGSFLPLCEF